MAVEINSTLGAKAQGVKVLVYGMSGVGKTYLISTLPNPIVLSAESGLLSLSGFDIPYVEVQSIEDLKAARLWLTTQNFESVALDSISEMAEVCLVAAKKNNKDPRAAYGEMADAMGEIIRLFRDLPGKNVYFSAKCEKVQDEKGRMLYGPAMPGKQIGQALPYYFDMVFALRKETDADGNVSRALMTDSDGLWQAKNRGGKLDLYEAPDLGAIIKKVKE